jgi:hypothetical protein
VQQIDRVLIIGLEPNVSGSQVSSWTFSGYLLKRMW